MRNVLILNEGLSRSGVPISILKIIERLINDFNFCFGCTTKDLSNDEAIIKKVKSMGCPVYFLNSHYVNKVISKIFLHFINVHLWRKVKKIIINNSIDIVHIFDYLPSGYLCKKLSKKGIRSIVHVNMDKAYPKRMISKLIFKYNSVTVSKYCYRVLAPSYEIGEHYGYSYSKIVPIFVPTNVHQLEKIELDEKKSVIRLGQVGSYCKRKNQLFSISILEQLIQDGVKAELSLMGFESENGFLDTIKRTIDEKKLYKYVHFYDSTYDLETFYDMNDIILFPSTLEGVGIVPIESQKRLTPVLCSTFITHEIDFGLCSFLELDVSLWKEKILDIYFSSGNYCLSKSIDLYEAEHFFDIIKRIYLGDYDD